MKEKIGIDLTWVRHGKIGGTESNTRNILDGIAKLNNQDNLLFILFVTKDNADSFKKYSEYKCFELYVCNILSSNKLKRVIWQNMKFGKLLKRKKIRLLFEPVYGMPFWGMSGIRVITTIHDLQALHYLQYFKRIRNIWMKLIWRNAVKSSYVFDESISVAYGAKIAKGEQLYWGA